MMRRSFVLVREQMQRADAEVEAVEHRVAGEQHADEDEPDGVEIESAWPVVLG